MYMRERDISGLNYKCIYTREHDFYKTFMSNVCMHHVCDIFYTIIIIHVFFMHTHTHDENMNIL